MKHALVVEDQDLTRYMLAQEVQSYFPDCTVHGAPNLDSACKLIHENEMDLIIIDPGLPGFDSISTDDRMLVVETIINASPKALHFIFTGHDKPEEATLYENLGASGYVSKIGFIPGMLPHILQDIAANGFSMRLAGEHDPSTETFYPGLTEREHQIVQWMMRRPPDMKRKDTFRQAARHYGIDQQSAERYYKQARAKLLKRGKLPDGI